MLNNLKISTSLIIIFGIFTLLQISSSTLGFERARDSAHDFDNVVELNLQREYLSSAKEALLRARIESNKTVIYTLSGNTEAANRLLSLSEQDLKIAHQQFTNFFNLEFTSEKGKALEQPIQESADALIGVLSQQLEALRSNGAVGYMKFNVDTEQSNLDEATGAFINHIQTMIEDKNKGNASDLRIATIQLILEIAVVLFIISAALIWLNRTVSKPLQLLLTHFEHVTNGDLTQHVHLPGKNEIAKLFNFFEKMQDSLIKTVTTVRDTTNIIVSGVEKLATGNDDLSARTEEQASSLEETAASMEELTSTVRLNADNARSASNLAMSTSVTASKGGEITQTVVTTMREISESSQKIGAITSVIDGIAFQTNILALNAAVEAARAGEQGRGFAVVAGEVRNLAQRSAQAAREIKQLIDDALERVNVGSSLVENAGLTMDEIVSSVSKVTDIIGEISSASDEQSHGIDLVSQAVNQMDLVTQQNSRLVHDLASSARLLEQQAEELENAVSVFKTS